MKKLSIFCFFLINSVFYYQHEFKPIWLALALENFKLLEYTVDVSKSVDTEEDHFVVGLGVEDSKFNKQTLQ